MKSALRAETTSGSRRRSFAGVIVALLLLPFLLGSESCFWPELKTPIGDSERGWADPRISGVWLGELVNEEPSDFSGWIWVLEPYDSKNWLVTWVAFKDKGESGPAAAPSDAPPAEQVSPAAQQLPANVSGPRPALNAVDVLRIIKTLGDERAGPAHIAVFKGWMTTLGGRRFLVLEPKAVPSTERGFRPESWWVFRADLQDGRLLLSVLAVDTEGLYEATTRAKAEAIIARHAADPKFATLMFTLHPVPRTAYDQAGKALGRAIGLE